MPINEWSDTIMIVELGDEPDFSEDFRAMRPARVRLLLTSSRASGP